MQTSGSRSGVPDGDEIADASTHDKSLVSSPMKSPLSVPTPQHVPSLSPSPSRSPTTLSPTALSPTASNFLLQDVPSNLLSASNSNSSNSKSKSTHYGTRSRNRPASARINYAEDVEMDFERPQSSLREIALKSPAFRPPSMSTSNNINCSKKSNPVSNGWNAINNNANTSTNSTIPGTSTFSANPNVSVPKKRKQPSTTTPNTNGNGSAPANSSIPQTRHSTNQHQLAASGRNLYSFEKTGAKLKNGKLTADDGTVFSVNDHVYLLCEPPAEPYYLGRIMEFIWPRDDSNNSNGPVDTLRINWFYRPRDIGRFITDTRVVYATMHSDTCPLTSLRGKCTIKHKAEFDDEEAYRVNPDHFYFSQAFHRFMHKTFDVILSSQAINLEDHIKKALDERWKYLIVEPARAKELTSAVKSCKRCNGYCASHDSVECAVCHKSYHMKCVNPPLSKKPSRGFAWACGTCSRAQERKLEARRTPQFGRNAPRGGVEEEEAPLEEEEEEALPHTITATPTSEPDDQLATEAEADMAKLWNIRYLGIHSRVEELLQYDDRAIYPRASSRIGARHQAIVEPWPGQPVQLVRPLEIRKKTGSKKDPKVNKETMAKIEADRAEKANRPKWVQDEPPGYVARGEDHDNSSPDCTALTIYRPPPPELKSEGFSDKQVEYMVKARKIMHNKGLPKGCVDFLDRALMLNYESEYKPDIAIKQLRSVPVVGKWPEKGGFRTDLRDPRFVLKDEEKKRFEEGVAKYGSELRLVQAHVRTVSNPADITRYWYYWKKTPRGREVWEAFGGRKNKSKKSRPESEAAAKLLDDIVDKTDDSAFDNKKIDKLHRKMVCKYCSVKHSHAWQKAPTTSSGQNVSAEPKNKKEQVMVALCQRCARLWRRYAIQWEGPDDVGRKVAQGGSKSWKKKVDAELIKDWDNANRASEEALPEPSANPPVSPTKATAAAPSKSTATAPSDPAISETPPIVITEPPKKKVKLTVENDQPKKKPPVVQPPAPPSPPVREPTPPLAAPKFKDNPCFVCHELGVLEVDSVRCIGCRTLVHMKCYGIGERERCLFPSKWICDTCINDSRGPNTIATNPATFAYTCALCPMDEAMAAREVVDMPKTTANRKKTEKDKERERQELALALNLSNMYRSQQQSRGRPQEPREALKKSVGRNWVHVSCAIFIPEVKFNDAQYLDSAEGIPEALQNRTSLCTICEKAKGATVQCHANNCSKTFHVTCAIREQYKFGLDATPIKGTRQNSVQHVLVGDVPSALSAVMYCNAHSSRKVLLLHEALTGDKSALQVFAENYKQADRTLAGTMRKATQLDEFTKAGSESATVRLRPREENSSRTVACIACMTDTSPRWHVTSDGKLHARFGREKPPAALVNGLQDTSQPHESKPRPHSSGQSGETSNPNVLCNSCFVKAKHNSEKMDIDPPPVQQRRRTVESREESKGSRTGWAASNPVPQDVPHGAWTAGAPPHYVPSSFAPPNLPTTYPHQSQNLPSESPSYNQQHSVSMPGMQNGPQQVLHSPANRGHVVPNAHMPTQLFNPHTPVLHHSQVPQQPNLHGPHPPPIPFSPGQANHANVPTPYSHVPQHTSPHVTDALGRQASPMTQQSPLASSRNVQGPPAHHRYSPPQFHSAHAHQSGQPMQAAATHHHHHHLHHNNPHPGHTTSNTHPAGPHPPAQPTYAGHTVHTPYPVHPSHAHHYASHHTGSGNTVYAGRPGLSAQSTPALSHAHIENPYSPRRVVYEHHMPSAMPPPVPMTSPTAVRPYLPGPSQSPIQPTRYHTHEGIGGHTVDQSVSRPMSVGHGRNTYSAITHSRPEYESSVGKRATGSERTAYDPTRDMLRPIETGNIRSSENGDSQPVVAHRSENGVTGRVDMSSLVTSSAQGGGTYKSGSDGNKRLHGTGGLGYEPAEVRQDSAGMQTQGEAEEPAKQRGHESQHRSMDLRSFLHP